MEKSHDLSHGEVRGCLTSQCGPAPFTSSLGLDFFTYRKRTGHGSRRHFSSKVAASAPTFVMSATQSIFASLLLHSGFQTF